MNFFITLSYDGWLLGISYTCVLIYGCIFGIFIIYKAKKTNAKLLLYAGLVIFFNSLTYLGAGIDFITILLTGKNMDNPHSLRLTLGWMWFAPLMIFAMYMFAELIIPKKKYYILAIYLVLGIIFELFLFLALEGSVVFVYPETSGEDLIEPLFIYGSPLFILNIIYWLSALPIGFGYLFKSFQSEGIIKNKFQFLSIATFLLIAVGVNNNVIPLSIFTSIFLVGGMVVAFWFFYLALREETEEPKRLRPRKEVKVKSDLFILSKYKKEDITEEEVSLSKEKKVCLVCKGKVLGFNNFICYKCEIFYCKKCAQALIDLENACWVCNEPFDDSKPSKPYRDEKIDVKISSEKDSSEKPKKI